MRDWSAVRERYMRDELPIRLGGLAANLARLSTAAKVPLQQHLADNLLDESKWFIEWTAAEAEIDAAAQLVVLQLQLASWQSKLEEHWSDFSNRSRIAEQAQTWSDRVLELSGLLDRDDGTH